jgi:hypothetical protein
MATPWTPAEIEAAKAALQSGLSPSEVAAKLNRTASGLRKAFSQRRLGPPISYVGREEAPEQERAEALGGWSPDHDMTRTVPVGFHVRGVSTLYDSAGQVAAQWVKSAVDKDAELRALIEAMKHLADPFRGTSELVDAPEQVQPDLLVVYPMGDPHIGMYAWAAESGDDFDLNIAEDQLVAATDKLVALAPNAPEALIIDVGDFFHADNSSNKTAHSGNALDVDTRWAKVFRVGVRAMRRCIDKALTKHELVRLWVVPGNHDDHTAQALAVCMSMYYENNPRVVVDLSPAAFFYHRFGDVLLGATHGNTVKPADLPAVMAYDRAEDWGRSKHRHWYTGHVHHDTVKEYRGCTVETVRTLAARDAWHARSGYRAGRDMKLDVWHRTHGHINRHIVGIDQLTLKRGDE